MTKPFKKISIYLDTSVPSFLFDEDPAKQEITEKFFKEIEKKKIYEGFISEIGIIEIDRTTEEQKKKAIKTIISNFKVLPITEEVKTLAERYLKEKIIPRKYRDDAVHIAAATVNNMDILVSWNFRHIVRIKTKMVVNGINQLLGYKKLEIISPPELVGGE